FFSSRRRHTRSKRDWSSDVCSSDLAINWGLIGLFQFNLVAAIFGDGGFARFIYTIVGISGLICIGMLFNADTVDVPAREDSQGKIGRASCREGEEIEVGAGEPGLVM